MSREITIEGYTPEELLALPDDQIRAYVFTGEPLIFRVGSAELLGEFRLSGSRLVVELAEVRGGGEGVLPLLAAVAERYARSRALVEVEWVVHAVTCAAPNLKLRRVLERRGFQVRQIPGVGEAYHLVRAVGSGQAA